MGFGVINENYWLGMAKRLILCDNPYHARLYMRGSRGGVGVQKPPSPISSHITKGFITLQVSKVHYCLRNTLSCWNGLFPDNELLVFFSKISSKTWHLYCPKVYNMMSFMGAI